MNSTRLNKQTGFGLLELMVALALGVLVIGGVVQVFYTTQQTYIMQQAMSRVQESGRFAIELISPELRKSAKLNFCIADLDIQNMLDPTGPGYVDELFDPSQAIVGWNFNNTDIGDTYNLPSPLVAGSANGSDWTSTNGQDLPDVLANLAVPGTDVILIKSAEAVEGLTGCGNNVPGSSSVVVNINNNSGCAPTPVAPQTDEELELAVPQEGIVLITDCSTGGDLFQRANQATANSFSNGVGAAGGDPGNENGLDWSASYDDSAQVYTVRIAGFFIGTNDSGGNSLYRINLGRGGSNAIAEELVEGVESFQVLFGVMLDNSGRLQYVEPDQVNAVGSAINIVSIQVSFLIRSENNADLETDDQTYDLVSTTIDPVDDNRLRRVFTTTVGIRNRIGS